MPSRDNHRRESTNQVRQDAAVNTLKRLPTKWAIVIVVALIGYVLLQPRLNQWFDWNLPSLAGLAGDESPKAKRSSPKPSEVDKTNAATKHSDSDNHPKPSTKKEESANTPSINRQEPNVESKDSSTFLKEIAKDRFESPAGLIYGRGSEEGHRLKHLARHLEDQPDRPGPHGVFRGSMDEFLVAIDDAYVRAKRGAKGTKKSEDNGRTIYEASFEKAIGFLGGQTGLRKKNPSLKRLQIVVERNAVITAFPIQ